MTPSPPLLTTPDTPSTLTTDYLLDPVLEEEYYLRCPTGVVNGTFDLISETWSTREPTFVLGGLYQDDQVVERDEPLVDHSVLRGETVRTRWK